MPQEIDEYWVEEAIARHRRSEQLQAALQARLPTLEVSVRSPDDLVEVRVGTDGTVRAVTLAEAVQGRTGPELSRAVEAAVGAAPEAARWARHRLYADLLCAGGG